MDKQKLEEAQCNAEAARLNLETALTHLGKKPMSGTLRNARQQLAKAALLMDEWEAALVPGDERTLFAADLPSDKPTTRAWTWTRLAKGMELALYAGFEVYVSGTRGQWAWAIHNRGEKKPLKSGEAKSKNEARGEGIGWAMELCDEEQREREARRSKGIGYDRMERAAEKARVALWDSIKHDDDVDKPMTKRDFSNLMDSFVSELLGGLDPEETP